MRLFNRNATFPSAVYARFGADSIEEFCTILIEEARIEGVKPEVVFAQAMHETGMVAFRRAGEARAM